MGLRRKAREIALQVLFSWDTQAEVGLTPEEAFRLHQENFHSPKAAREFAYVLVSGVISNLDVLDGLISRCSKNWKVSRMGIVDRNILRISVHEMLSLSDVPAPVSINEAVELAKRFGTLESGPFINGILDAVKEIVEPEAGSGERAPSSDLAAEPSALLQPNGE